MVITIPIVSLGAGDDEECALAVAAACTSTGFFYLAAHGIPTELIDRVMALNRQLFKMPLEVKAGLAADGNNRGWTAFQEETLDPEHQASGDTKEGFYFGREVAADEPEARLPLHGPNQWPDEDLVPGYRAAMEVYYAALLQLGRRLLRLLAMSLELEADYFLPFFSRPLLFLRPLHYHAVLSSPGQGIFGAGAHSDYGMLTLLITDDQPGLQIHMPQHGWLDVPPRPGCFIVNLGDMLERWTNGRYRSTLHRVINTTAKERYSLAAFLDPNFDARVECLPQCCSADRPARYPPTTAGQHILDKYAATHAGFTAKPVPAEG